MKTYDCFLLGEWASVSCKSFGKNLIPLIQLLEDKNEMYVTMMLKVSLFFILYLFLYQNLFSKSNILFFETNFFWVVLSASVKIQEFLPH